MAGFSNGSELIMKRFALGPDEFQMQLFFMSFIIMFLGAFVMGELEAGFQFFFMEAGTAHQEREPTMPFEHSWPPRDKMIILTLFSTMGLFGGSCACAITKRFGALTMSVTTTARKAGTLFLSFALFPNECTVEHVIGVGLFLFALLLKSSSKAKKSKEETVHDYSFTGMPLPENKMSHNFNYEVSGFKVRSFHAVRHDNEDTKETIAQTLAKRYRNSIL